MYITAVTASGFRDLPRFEHADLGRAVHLKGPTPATTALGDAVELAFAALSPAGLVHLLRRWELLAEVEQPEVLGAPFPDQAVWTDREAARALVADTDERALVCSVDIALDPPLFGALRSHAVREPRLVAALSEGARIRLEVGALFAVSFDAVAVDLRGVSVGAERFPTRDGDRPPWLQRLLVALSGRFHRHDPTADTAVLALTAATARRGHGGYLAWQRCLGPDNPVLRAARGPGGRALLLADDLPLRRLGATVRHRVDLGAAVHLAGADVLWAESGEAWLDDAVTGVGSPLEQVWRVSPAGDIVVEPAEPPPRRS